MPPATEKEISCCFVYTLAGSSQCNLCPIILPKDEYLFVKLKKIYGNMDAIHMTVQGQPDSCVKRETVDKVSDNLEHGIKIGNPEAVQPVLSAKWLTLQKASGLNQADELAVMPKITIRQDNILSKKEEVHPILSQKVVETDASEYHEYSRDHRYMEEGPGLKSCITMKQDNVLSKQVEIINVVVENKDAYIKCSICDKHFTSITTLNNHLKTHSKERPHICKDCNRPFKQMSNLIQHRRIHTGERPYGCSYCEKSFKQKSQVMQHERLHTGEKPYVCSHCQRAFVQLSQLKYHEKTHKSKDSVVDDDGKYTKSKRRRKRNLQKNYVHSSFNEVSPVYILTEEDMASGTISFQL